MDAQLISSTTPLRMLFVVLVCVSLAVASSCPPDAKDQAKRCTAIMGLHVNANDPSEFIQEGNGDMALHACGNGDLLNVVSCLERVLDKCKHDNSNNAHFLRKMIDIEKARYTVTFFCTNVRTYVKHADCIRQHHQDQVECANDAMKNFQTQASATSNIDSLMLFQCKFYFKALQCTEKVLTEKCSSDVAAIVRTVMEGFEPPTCQDYRPKSVAAEKTGYDIERQGRSNDVDDNGGENSAYAFGAHMVVFLVGLFLTLLT